MVFEIFFVIVVVFALAARAKQRGVNPTGFVIGALLGWFALLWIDLGWSSGVQLLLRWAPVFVLFMMVEFARPSRHYIAWECPDCHTVNATAALTCGQCRRLRPDVRA